MEYECHFSHLGWTGKRKNGEVFWFEGESLEAIRIIDENMLLSVFCPTEEKWLSNEEQNYAGTTGEKKIISAIRISNLIDNNNTPYYRIYLRGIGWTCFYRAGEICGVTETEADAVIEGIQIVIGDKAQEERMLYSAEDKLKDYTQKKRRLHIHNPNPMLLAYTENYESSQKINVVKVEQGILLPLKPDLKHENSFLGGVVDRNQRWIAGMERNGQGRGSLSCVEGYLVSENELENSSETVIFGGVIRKTFGHLLTESLSRLWYVLLEEAPRCRIAVLVYPGHEEFAYDFFELLDIGKERLFLVDHPMRFKEVIVPDQSIRLWSDYHPEYLSIFEKMKEKVKPDILEKVYLTRTALDKADGINEKYYEKFFKKRGFAVVSPEQYSVKKQIAILSGAKEVVCTEGTLSHLGIFCNSGTHLIIIRRLWDEVLIPQCIINQARELKVSYFDGTYNFLPIRHSKGVFLYGPTEYFRDFLLQNKYRFKEKELLSFDLKDYCYDYIKKWCENYSRMSNFKTISDMTLTDVLLFLNRVFENKEIDRDKYVVKSEQKEKNLLKEIAKLKKENKK